MTRKNELTASEALFGFCGWLTTREEITVMSASNDAAPIADLIKRFCEENELSIPRTAWASRLKHPKE